MIKRAIQYYKQLKEYFKLKYSHPETYKESTARIEGFKKAAIEFGKTERK